jgi:hypothetical protein
MDANYPTIDEPATPDYVLAVLADHYRQACAYDPEVEPGEALSFDTTVAEWRAICDLARWRKLGRCQNEWWDINCTDAEWDAVLNPASKRTLRDVCQLIASRARAPRIAPSLLLGRACLTAGVFRTIRAMLAEVGADASVIAPPAPLAPYARRYGHLLLAGIARLAPGALPPVKVSHALYDAMLFTILLGMVLAVIGGCGSVSWLIWLGVGLAIAGYLGMWIASGCTLPRRVEFGELRTFRDLSVAIANHLETRETHS